MPQELKNIIQSFKYDGQDPEIDIKLKNARVSKKPSVKRNSSPKKTIKQVVTDTTDLPDLRQSLGSNLTVLFIGFNPGVQSSIQQHHYAHHSNLFWKLFNQSKLLEKTVAGKKKDGVINNETDNNDHLRSLLDNGCSAKDDFDLIHYDIGFTDLALRCTATAAELTTEEKLHNIPRLLQEINSSHPENVVLIGKGIWEVFVKYYISELGMKFKLNKDNFQWGKLKLGADKQYNRIIEQLLAQIPPETSVYVFPSTSGLVASMSFQEKLNLWQSLANNIQH
ncbi:thp1 [Candida margitis]|uniref:thp1 n=1 Tax=Candida margitis TaxID=1775924 RepID=UPI002225DD28|nr:thp1 [Candida margitis]KAI5958483.1 thp1 [Candida margitis]